MKKQEKYSLIVTEKILRELHYACKKKQFLVLLLSKQLWKTMVLGDQRVKRIEYLINYFVLHYPLDEEKL